MLNKIFMFVGLALISISASASACPIGSVPAVTNTEICFTWTDTSVDDPFATYDGAEFACQNKGGHLATISNQEENTYLSGIIGNKGNFFWIGINDLETYGKWDWEDGSPVNYLNWDQHGPGSYHCGVFMQSDGSWRTTECGTKILYICSIPANHNTAGNIHGFAVPIFISIIFLFFFNY